MQRVPGLAGTEAAEAATAGFTLRWRGQAVGSHHPSTSPHHLLLPFLRAPQSCYLFCSFLEPFWIPSSHGHCSHNCSSLHILGHFFVICKYEIKQSIFPYWLPNHPCQDTIIRVLQRPPGLLVLSLPEVAWMVKFYHDNCSLQVSGFFQVQKRYLCSTSSWLSGL